MYMYNYASLGADIFMNIVDAVIFMHTLDEHMFMHKFCAIIFTCISDVVMSMHIAYIRSCNIHAYIY